jgi:nitrogen fixation/metabolism regulation signal transduction histidine kinase
MAYEEGEFSQLADSISEMMVRLKALQRKLGTTEKIAAWQAMGRKIAHEVKNPLTPIAISIDDLRRSHAEQQPDFDRILLNTTATIKTEVTRLNEMLDQFVRFARMKPPVMGTVKLDQILDRVRTLYNSHLENGRLEIINDIRRRTLTVDPDQIQQLLINLIKNSLETGPDTSVKVKLTDRSEGIIIRIEDSGPGFSKDGLAANFQPYLSTKKNGSGLGLVICQRIVFDHGGNIEIYNRESGGAGILIELPLGTGA